MLQIKKIKMTDVPECLLNAVNSRLDFVRRYKTIRKDAVVLVRIDLKSSARFSETFHFLGLRYRPDNVLKTDSRTEIYVVPLSKDGRKLSAREFFGQLELDTLRRDHLIHVMGVGDDEDTLHDLQIVNYTMERYLRETGAWEDYRAFHMEQQLRISSFRVGERPMPTLPEEIAEKAVD